MHALVTLTLAVLISRAGWASLWYPNSLLGYKTVRPRTAVSQKARHDPLDPLPRTRVNRALYRK